MIACHLDTEALLGKPLQEFGGPEVGSKEQFKVNFLVNDPRGIIAYEAFLPEACIYEVLDPATERPAAPGDAGELVVTPLFGEATPIIRFATGDRVRYLPAGSCHCGRTGGGIEAGTVSRYDSMVKIRGVNVWPEAVDEVVFSFPGVADYAAEVFTDETQGSEQVRLAVEFAAADPGERRRTLEALGPRLQERIGIRVEVVAHTGPALVAAVPDDWAKRSRWRDRRRTTQLS